MLLSGVQIHSAAAPNSIKNPPEIKTQLKTKFLQFYNLGARISTSMASATKNYNFDINLSPFFRTSAYCGYADTAKGFFRVYGDLFQTLLQQEIAYARSMGAGPVSEAPLIGNLGSPYAQVRAFYKYWRGFSTVKDFNCVGDNSVSAWANGKTRKLMERENKKLVKTAKGEYNKTVRQLAEFVKKRDTRVLERELQMKKEKEVVRAKHMREKLEKEKLVRARQHEEQEWARVDKNEEVEEDGNPDSHDGWYDHDVKCKKGSDSSQPGGNRKLYCLVCKKNFKSDKQWKNHEQSKKHRARVLELGDMFEDHTLLDGVAKDIDQKFNSDSPVQGMTGYECLEQHDTRVHGENIVAELDNMGNGENIVAELDNMGNAAYLFKTLEVLVVKILKLFFRF